MKRWTGIAAAVFLFASGCASYSNTESAKSQIAFGANVARKGLWREAAFRFEQAIIKDPKNARAHNNLAVALEAVCDPVKNQITPPTVVLGWIGHAMTDAAVVESRTPVAAIRLRFRG